MDFFKHITTSLFRLVNYALSKIRSIKKSDNKFNKIIKNAFTLLSGNFIGDVLGLISMIILARVLKPNDFGIFTLIITYVAVVDGLVNFQTWQALIKYGAEFLKKNDELSFKKIIKLGFILDGGTAFLGFILAITAFPYVSSFLSIEADHVELMSLACIMILFHIKGAPIAILRLFDEFKIIAGIRVVTSIIKLVSVFLGYILDFELVEYLIIWIAVDILNNLILIHYSIVIMNRNGMTRFITTLIKPEDLKTDFKGFFGFVLTTNLHSSVKLGVKHLDVLLISRLMDPTAAGILRITKQVSEILLKLSGPFYQSIYPELSKLWVARDLTEFRSIIKKSIVIATIGGVVFWIGFLVFGELIIQLTVGKEYLQAYSVIVFYMLGVIIATASFPLQPAMLAMGKQNVSFRILVFSVFVYFCSIYYLTEYFGVEGVGIAFILYYTVWVILISFFQNRFFTKQINSDIDG